jgi:hypothetical protein
MVVVLCELRLFNIRSYLILVLALRLEDPVNAPLCVLAARYDPHSRYVVAKSDLDISPYARHLLYPWTASGRMLLSRFCLFSPDPPRRYRSTLRILVDIMACNNAESTTRVDIYPLLSFKTTIWAAVKFQLTADALY